MDEFVLPLLRTERGIERQKSLGRAPRAFETIQIIENTEDEDSGSIFPVQQPAQKNHLERLPSLVCGEIKPDFSFYHPGQDDGLEGREAGVRNHGPVDLQRRKLRTTSWPRRGLSVLITESQVHPEPLAGSHPLRRSLSRSQTRKERLEVIFCERAGDYEKAAALIDQATDGRGLPEGVLEKNGRQVLQAYNRYHSFYPLWLTSYACLLLINLVEVPPWCRAIQNTACADRDKYFMRSTPYMQPLHTAIAQIGVSLVLLTNACLHIAYHIGARGSNLNLKLAAKPVMVLALLSNALAALLGSPLAVSLGPFLRVLAIVSFSRDIRRAFKIVKGIVEPLFVIGILVCIYILFFSWLAQLLFGDLPEGAKYFGTLPESIASMATLLTTVNYPGVAIGLYRKYPASSLFFVIYLAIGVYFLMGILFGTVFNSYKQALAADLGGGMARRNRCLKKAFRHMDPGKSGFINVDNIERLLFNLEAYVRIPHLDRSQVRFYFEILDKDRDEKLSETEFLEFISTIMIKFEPINPPTPLETLFPSLSTSASWQGLKDILKGHWPSCLIVAVLIPNLVAVTLELGLEPREAPALFARLRLVELGVLCAYASELALKCGILGWGVYWAQSLNRLDFVLTLPVLAVLAINNISFAQAWSPDQWLQWILVFQLIRIVHPLSLLKPYKVIGNTLLRLTPAILPLVLMLLCLMCFWTALGVQLFGGLVYKGNPALEGLPYKDLGYVYHNFNDFAGGLLTVFSLLIAHDWIVFMEGFRAATGSPWTRLYFISFFIIGFVFMVKLVSAFVLHGFLTQLKKVEEDKMGKDQQFTHTLSQNALSIGVREDFGSLSAMELIRDILPNEVQVATLKEEQLLPVTPTAAAGGGEKENPFK